MYLSTLLTTGVQSQDDVRVKAPGLLADSISVYLVLQAAASTSTDAGVNQTILSNYNYVAVPAFDDTAAMRMSTLGPGAPANYWKCTNAWQQDANGTFAAATPTILSAVFPGFLYVNGTKVASPLNKLMLNASKFGLGCTSNAALRFGGLIGRVLIYRGAHTQAQRWVVEAALSSFFGITVVQQ